MQVKCYGVGVGPGDPELMTLKAVRVLKECDIVALPGVNPKETVAYKIALGACPFLESKPLLALDMPMTKDETRRIQSHENASILIKEQLDQGKNVVFLTLGDPTIYSTYIYVHQKLLDWGYDANLVSGIPSFCAAAARLNIGLVEKDEMLHVIPASYKIEEALAFKGTKVLMKTASKMKEVKEQLINSKLDVNMVENCGMPNERVTYGADAIEENSGYFSLIVAKEIL